MHETHDEHLLRERNRRSWNAATEAHRSHRGDEVAFFRAGGSTLFPEERALLGEVAGLSLLHLQCNTGRDSLSLAALGAQVTGIDISDTAIDHAQSLTASTGLTARFIRQDVYDWLNEAAQRQEDFDIVFCSYGAVCWLSDLHRWANGIASVLRVGGRFVVVDFHPVAAMFDDDWRLVAPYGGGRHVSSPEGVGDYVGASGEGLTPAEYREGVTDFQNPHACHLYQWGIGEIITALAQAGLTIETLREYPYVNGERCFPGLKIQRGRQLTLPDHVPDFPLMFGIAARRP